MLKRTVSGILFILLLIGMLALAFDIQPAKSEPKVIIVPDHYPTIQEAINNADDGDLIYVRSGVYYENVVVNKTVSLLGENRNSTIIDGGGNGTVVIIENAINITLNGFTIRDSGTKIDNRTMFPSCGVFVWADNARILNNCVIENYVGVYLGCSQNDVLRNNDIRDNVYNFGVDRYGFHHDIDSSNTVNGKPIFYLVNQACMKVPPNAGYVAAIDCQEVVAKNLILTNNWNGILFAHTDDSTIENVTVASNYYGVCLSGSSYDFLQNNNLTHNRYNFGVHGDSLSHYIQHVDTSNTVNRKPIYYLVNQTKLRIDPATIPKPGIGYLAIVNSTEIIIENLALTDNIQGLLFAYTTDSTIRNVGVSENCEGIMFYQSKHNTIAESYMHTLANNITEMATVGIHLYSSSNNSIYGNSITNARAHSGVGIELYKSSNDNLLALNNVENYTRGICIVESGYNNVSENIIINNSCDGIFVDLPGYNNVVGNDISRNGWSLIGGAGIHLKRTSCWNSIVGNEIRDNAIGILGDSIYLPSIIGTSIIENNIINNTYGIAILPGWESDVEVFHNNFINNTYQVYAIIPYNFRWDNGYPSAGNYWSNYTGVDFYSGPYQNETGSDGVGDTRHVIDANNTDRYPLMIPWTQIPPPIWNRTFGGPYNDWADDVEVTSDGGYIIAGSTNSSGAGCYDFWLVKTDINGNQLWNKTYGGIGDDWAFGIAVPGVISPAKEGYIIAGTTNSSGAGDYDVWLVKTDVDGNQLWNKTYGGVEFDAAYDVEKTTDGEYIVAGGTESFTGIADFWLLKIDSNGNELWNRTFNGPGWDIDVAYDVEVTADGGYILAGVTYLGGVLNQVFWLVKTDSNGNKQWDSMFFPGPEDINKAFGVAVSPDGGYTVVGTSFAPMRNKVWLVKTDSNGAHEWNRTYSVTGWDGAMDMESTPDKGYIIAGSAGDDFGLIKIDFNGTQQWVKTFGGPNADRAMDVELAPNGGYIVVGDTNSFGAGEYDHDFWLVRFKVHDIAVTRVKPSKNIVAQGYSVFINVTIENQGDYTETFNVTLYYNETAVTLPNGKNYTTTTLTSGNSTTIAFTWNTTGVAKGNYTIRAYAWPVPGETDTDDNLYVDGTVQIVICTCTPWEAMREYNYTSYRYGWKFVCYVVIAKRSCAPCGCARQYALWKFCEIH